MDLSPWLRTQSGIGIQRCGEIGSNRYANRKTAYRTATGVDMPLISRGFLTAHRDNLPMRIHASATIARSDDGDVTTYGLRQVTLCVTSTDRRPVSRHPLPRRR
jgi:hypothetical protein